MKINKIIWFALVNFASGAQGEICQDRRVSAYFANGMFNSRETADQSRAVLASRADQKIILAYNTNEAVLNQLIQVVRQKRSDLDKSFWLKLSEIEPVREFRTFNAGLTSLAESILLISQQTNERTYLNDHDLSEHLHDYRHDLAKGRRVAVIAHSQGNFYANAAGEMLNAEERRRFDVLAVATPANYVFKDGSYLTLKQDRVIAAVRATQGALPPNLDEGESALLGHDFVSQYLRGYKAGSVFSQLLQSILGGGESREIYTRSFVHESLRPFWQYVLNQSYDPPRRLSDPECLATLTFFGTYMMPFAGCEHRSLEAVIGQMNHCRYNTSSKIFYSTCVRYSSYSIPVSLQLPILAIFMEEEHPECYRFNERSAVDHLQASFAEAQRLLRSPPSRSTVTPQPQTPAALDSMMSSNRSTHSTRR